MILYIEMLTNMDISFYIRLKNDLLSTIWLSKLQQLTTYFQKAAIPMPVNFVNIIFNCFTLEHIVSKTSKLLVWNTAKHLAEYF